MEWYLKVVRDNYANFSGRARRQEYWMFVLINLLISLGLLAVFATLASVTNIVELIFIPYIYMLGVFIPSLAVAVRRLHDTNKSGWMYLVSLIPIVGPIWLLVLFATEGDRGNNQYGSDPKTTSGGYNDFNSTALDENVIH